MTADPLPMTETLRSVLSDSEDAKNDLMLNASRPKHRSSREEMIKLGEEAYLSFNRVGLITA